MIFKAIPIAAERHIGWDLIRRLRASFISRRSRDPQVKILIIITDTHTYTYVTYITAIE